jgi:DNA invertase Pin-like site-specific DNA recombinase
MKHVGYIRCSKGDQKDSPARQREIIENWCRPNGLFIDEWYVDIGGRRSEDTNPKRRKEFQRLLREAEARKFTHIVVSEQDRFGVPDLHAWGHYMWVLRNHGITLQEAATGRILTSSSTDLGGGITSAIGAIQSTTECVTKATRTLSAKLRDVVAKSSWQGGPITSLAAVQCTTAGGSLLWTVERRGASYRQFYSDGREVLLSYFPRDRAPTDVLRLVPSPDPVRRAAITLIFEMYAQGHGASPIAAELNKQGFRTDSNGLYYSALIILILRRGVIFAGRYVYARSGQGRYARHTTGTNFRTTDRIDTSVVRRDRSEWIVTEPYADPVISEELWLRCQTLLESRQYRASRHDGAAYAGLLRCAGCGARMSSYQRRGRQSYVCTTYRNHRGACGPNEVFEAKLDGIVNQYLQDMGVALSAFSEQSPIVGLYTDRRRLLDRSKAIRKAMELYLYDRLALAFDYEQRGDHRHFCVPQPPGPDAQFRLPDYEGDPAFLENLTLAVEHSENARIKREVAQLEGEHGKLYEDFRTMPTEMMRRRCLADIERVERQLALRNGTPTTFGSELRSMVRHLHQATLRAGKAKATTGAARRAALQKVVAEIRCRFEPISRGARTLWELTSITIVPQLGDERVIPVNGATVPERCS